MMKNNKIYKKQLLNLKINLIKGKIHGKIANEMEK